MPIKILILDSSEIVRAGLSELLSTVEGFQVIGATGSSPEAERLLAAARPAVVVLDLGKPDAQRLEFVHACRQQFSATRMLVFTSQDCIASARQLMQAGVDGYLVKEAGKEEIVSAIRAIVAGRKLVSVSQFGDPLPAAVVPAGTLRVDPGGSKPLSLREQEVLALVARGKTNQQAADELFLSVKTIETYRSRLAKKVGATSRADLFEYASATGLLAVS
jgi:DNA-binding NarL/FixJ family response regulator